VQSLRRVCAGAGALLGSDALTELVCWNCDLLDVPAAGVLADALRANATLTSLNLRYATNVLDDPDAATELLGALTDHASLRVLHFSSSGAEAAFQEAPQAAHQAAVGASLGALIAVNAPALTELSVCDCSLGDDGLRPLVEALPANTHLRALKCHGNDMSDAFAADVLLPAVRANESLRTMGALGYRYAAADDSIARELSSRPPL
jgi:hypothetical protein